MLTSLGYLDVTRQRLYLNSSTNRSLSFEAVILRILTSGQLKGKAASALNFSCSISNVALHSDCNFVTFHVSEGTFNKIHAGPLTPSVWLEVSFVDHTHIVVNTGAIDVIVSTKASASCCFREVRAVTTSLSVHVQNVKICQFTAHFSSNGCAIFLCLLTFSCLSLSSTHIEGYCSRQFQCHQCRDYRR